MKNKFLKLNKINFTLFYFVIIFLFVILIPNKTFSASVDIFSEGEISVGDTNIFSVFLNTEDKLINSISGAVVLKSSESSVLKIEDISLVNSVFNMWPRKPSLEKEHKISFVGGIPGGVKGDRLLLFKVIVKTDKKGDLSLSSDGLVVYLNDGLGTSSVVSGGSNIISIKEKEVGSVSKNKWEETISNDKISPQAFNVSLFQDSSLYDGKKFISFESIDTESGISYYEVKEHNNPFVRSGTEYVLIYQDKPVDVVVVAYDKAGNFRISKLKESINWIGVIVVIIIIILIYQVVKLVIKRRKRKNDKYI